MSTLVYQPIGIYNMIVFRKYDRTWHLVNVNNEQALLDHLNNTLERLTNPQDLFKSHSIETYLTDLQQSNKQTTELDKIQTISNLISEFQSNENVQINKNLSLESNVNYSIVIPLPFRFSDYSQDQLRSGKSYTTMISMSPIYPHDTLTTYRSPSNDLEKQLLSAIKHRTGVLQINANNINEKKKTKSLNLTSAYDALLNMYNTYGIDARMEIMKLQLDQRMLVPIFVSKTRRNYPPFRSYIKTLSLVQTSVLHLNEHLLAFDSNLLRIGLISTIKQKTGGLPDFIHHIFHAVSIRLRIPGTGTSISVQTTVEIGYGFLQDPTLASSLSYEPVILVHVIGDYRRLTPLLAQYVDALIVEYNENNGDFNYFERDDPLNSLRIQRIMKWKHTIDADFDGITEFNEPYPMDEFEGSAKAVAPAFQEHLLDILHSKSFVDTSISPRPRLVDIIQDENLFFDDDISIIDMKTLFKNINTSDLKKNIFKLQQSYKIEAENQLQMDNPKIQLHDNKRKELDNNIREERQFRSKFQETVTTNSLFQSYLSIIAEPNDEKRYVNKRQFEFILSEFNEQTISVLREKKDETFNDMSNAIKDVLNTEKNSSNYVSLVEQQKQATAKHYEAKQEFISNSLVPEHFWREISHLYAINTSLYSTYPDLAAQHIIDGFSLELLDGDSMLLNTKWLEAVFDSINTKLHQKLNRQPRVLVLSICGPQSSGKSFLLKTMYGIRIRSSVGACTQGVNMMLVQVYQQEYDYVLLIDTEGIRAPEFMNLPGAELRDNILVTFAVLLADGTILLNKGEVNQALEEILPIVLYIYGTSSLSLQLGGQIPSKLFFVYNQIDTSQETKGKELLQDLTTRLYNITDQIRKSIPSGNNSFHGFEQCRLDLTNISNSDFRILTVNINNPPINHPVSLYGEQALQLRQWIDQRITNQTESHPWKARLFSDVLQYLKAVIDTIRQAHHITNVNTALEMLAYNNLNGQIENIKNNISANFTAIRIEVENEIIRQYTNHSSNETGISALLETKIVGIIEEGYKRVLMMMNDIIVQAEETVHKLVKGTKREIALRDGWDLFINEKKNRIKIFLATRIDREITKSIIIDKVQNQIRQDLIDECNKNNCTSLNDTTQETIFNDIFNRRIAEVQQPYHSGYVNVSQNIKAIYNKSFTIENVKIFDGNQFCKENGYFQWISNENELKHVKNVESKQERDDRIHQQSDEKRKFDDTINDIIPYTNAESSNAERYDEIIVHNILQHLKKIIDTREVINVNTLENIHRRTFCHLEYQLTELQNRWDSKHNRTLHLEENRSILWKFFQNVAQGIRGIKLLELDLINLFKNKWKDGFSEFLVDELKTEVAKERWIRNSEVLGAYIDRERIQILESKGIQALLRKMRSASEFYEKCMEKLVQDYIDANLEHTWNIFYNNTKDTIQKAGIRAKNSPNNCLQVFVDALKQSTLPWKIRSDIPSNLSIYGNVDDQQRNIFDSIVTNITLAVPENSTSKLNGDESKKILKVLREDPASDEAKPRCNHACRHCGAPCFKPFNHTGHHDFFHQPSGVVGSSWFKTNLIVHETCRDHFLRNDRFTMDGGKSWHSFSEYPDLHNYEIPGGASKRNVLSEYLMSKYHNEIARYYNIKPNPPVPVAYSEYSLEDIKKAINKTINCTAS